MMYHWLMNYLIVLQRELERCCDVVLHVAQRQYQAHRCVLAACSPYFDSIFKGKGYPVFENNDQRKFSVDIKFLFTISSVHVSFKTPSSKQNGERTTHYKFSRSISIPVSFVLHVYWYSGN